MVHAALGKRETYYRGESSELSKDECRTVRRQALSITVRAALIAVIAAVIAWLI